MPPEGAPLPLGEWRVMYYNAPNRGEQLRLLFEATQTPYEDIRIGPFPDGLLRFKAAEAGDQSPLAWDFVPVVQHGTPQGQVSVSTTAGAMHYAGEKLGLVPDDAFARATAVQLVVGAEAMRNEIFYGAYFKVVRKGAGVADIDQSPYHKWLGHFERFLRTHKRDSAFVLGDKVSYADLSIYDCVTAAWDLRCYEPNGSKSAVITQKAKYPLLCALVVAVGEIPAVRAYVEKRGDRHLIWTGKMSFMKARI
jgi:glutathione S-transferase